jgi:DNA-binding NtrC family response regulator
MTTTHCNALNMTLRVMLVEDDSRYRAMLVTMLRDLQCAPLPYEAAASALDDVNTARPDVIILDLNMPRMDGLMFLSRLRESGDETPVVILTGVGTLQSAQAAIRLGVREFLTKPCHMSDLEGCLDRVRKRMRSDTVADLATTEMDPAAASEPGDEPGASRTASKSPGTLADLERRAILEALRTHGGNRSAAAMSLGISRRTLHYRLAEYRGAGITIDAEPN